MHRTSVELRDADADADGGGGSGAGRGATGALVLLLCIAGAAAGAAIALAADEPYRTEARVALITEDGTVVDGGAGDAADLERALREQRALLVSSSVRRGAVRRTRPQGVADAERLAGGVKVEYPRDDLAVLELEGEPREALAPVVNAYADAFFDARRNRLRLRLQREASAARAGAADALADREDAIAEVLDASGAERERLLARARALDRRYRRLQERAATAALTARDFRLDAELVAVANPPPLDSDPEVTRYAAVGGGAGLLAGLLIALVLRRSRGGAKVRRRNEIEAVEAFYGAPLLASVAKTDALASGPVLPHELPRVQVEAFGMLAAAIRHFDIGTDIRSLLITSAKPGDGKSTVAFNLSSVLAAGGRRALLIETDLRLPTLAAKLGLPAGAGLADILAGDAEVDEVITQITVTPAHRHHRRMLDVVVAGRTRIPPAELLESERMADLLMWAEQRYDLIVLDTAPMAVVADGISLLRRVDAALVVGSVRTALELEATRLRELLRGTNTPVVGVVANFVSAREGETYGYGYAGASTDPDAPGTPDAQGARRREPTRVG